MLQRLVLGGLPLIPELALLALVEILVGVHQEKTLAHRHQIHQAKRLTLLTLLECPRSSSSPQYCALARQRASRLPSLVRAALVGTAETMPKEGDGRRRSDVGQVRDRETQEATLMAQIWTSCPHK